MIDSVSVLFLIILLVTTLLLYRWHRDVARPFDLSDLILEGGRVSKLALTWLGSFFAMTYAFVHAVAHGQLSDGYAMLYAATWAAPIVAKLFRPKEEDKKP